MHPTLRTLTLVLLVAALGLAIGCSTRQVYQIPANIAPAAPDAININTASVEELERLPRIGRKRAEAIVKFRDENGPFRRVEHMMQISAVSERRFLEIRPYMRTE